MLLATVDDDLMKGKPTGQQYRNWHIEPISAVAAK